MFHFHRPGHRRQMSWQRLTAGQMNERALFDMFAHPHHVGHVLLARGPLARRAVLLYVSVLSRLNDTGIHMKTHIESGDPPLTSGWVAYSL